MIAELSATLGLDMFQPLFWMPLLMMAMLSILILGALCLMALISGWVCCYVWHPQQSDPT